MNIGIPKEDYTSERTCYSPNFAVLEKNGRIRVITNFMKFNLLLNCKLSPFPVPKIGKAHMIRSMEEFTFATALELNIGYSQTKLDIDS
jgi:hypothetical protein